jgi:hypothetical protein
MPAPSSDCSSAVRPCRRRIHRAAVRDRLRVRGGGLREACPKEAIWQFTPFVFVDLRKHLWQMVRRSNQLAARAAARAGRARAAAPGARHPLRRDAALLPRIAVALDDGCIVLATVLASPRPIKIWNSARIEHRLQEQEKLLLAAKIEALKSQINPHFLFNTLTSISSLIRSQPDTARTLIIRLSALLRGCCAATSTSSRCARSSSRSTSTSTSRWCGSAQAAGAQGMMPTRSTSSCRA